MTTACCEQLTFCNLGQQQVTVALQGGALVTAAGLLAIGALDKERGVLAGLAERLPDPRAQKFVVPAREALRTQQSYQSLAGYADCNAAQRLRHDPWLQTVVDVPPSADEPLARGSTWARFQHAFTRRQAERPPEERDVLKESAAAQSQRLKILKDYLPELLRRTRRQVPPTLTLARDASDAPTHGPQLLTGFHGYFDQHPYFPLCACDGDSGLPLAAWWRPGTAHARGGAVDTWRTLVGPLRSAQPGVPSRVRGAAGLAVPDLYECCEHAGLPYAFGYGSNAVLKEGSAARRADLETSSHGQQHRAPHVQHFEGIADQQAARWSRPRRLVAKLASHRLGTKRRFVVTNLPEPPPALQQAFSVQRGDVPEKPRGALQNGLAAERWSFQRCRANALKLLEPTRAQALVVLPREATAPIPAVARAEVATLRVRRGKVAAVVQTSVRRLWFHFSATWPQRNLWLRVAEALRGCAAAVRAAAAARARVRPQVTATSPRSAFVKFREAA